MVDQPNLVLNIPKALDDGVENDLHKGDELSEDEPEIDHFQVGRGRQAVGDADEQGGQNKQGGQVDCDDGLKEEGLEVAGGEAHEAEQDCWQVNPEKGGHESSLEDYVHFDGMEVWWHNVGVHCNFLYKVLS